MRLPETMDDRPIPRPRSLDSRAPSNAVGLGRRRYCPWPRLPCAFIRECILMLTLLLI
jgi:hypothetical protein